MKRTVKAWCVQADGASRLACEMAPYGGLYKDDHAAIFLSKSSAAHYADAGGCEPDDPLRVSMCVITYDDGRPAPRKRTTGKQGGRRG